MYAKVHLVVLAFSVVAIFAFIAGCTQVPTATPSLGDATMARETLILFFTLLHDQRYNEAVSYYGGTYDMLRYWNPTLVDDYAVLFKNACTVNGLQCLKIGTILREEQITPTEFRFIVQFANDDGTLFMRGPCCGATETQMPTETQFTYTVKKVDSRYLVQDLPVYVP